ncbi:MAG TPA: CAP domain-containing protein [Gaiellales bacterium]|jgi:uncharacterized protein YkwD
MRRRVVRFVLCGLAVGTFLASTGVASAVTAPPRKQLLLAINRVRASYGMPSLLGAPALRTAALRHSEDMMARDYFAHTSPSGSTLASRIIHSGFVSGHWWRGGETLAWGIGKRASAAATVAAWLKSPTHRAIMLASGFHWVGIGRNCGRFAGYTGACVWTADFVVRR